MSDGRPGGCDALTFEIFGVRLPTLRRCDAPAAVSAVYRCANGHRRDVAACGAHQTPTRHGEQVAYCAQCHDETGAFVPLALLASNPVGGEPGGYSQPA
jgi:hypothetical protein